MTGVAVESPSSMLSPARSAGQRRRGRNGCASGETDLLEIVLSGSLHLDIALDRLREVL